MRTHRFYAPIELQENTSVFLPAEVAHHCTQVLRCKVGDLIIIFNGDSFDYLAVICEITKKQCFVKISTKQYPENESLLKIHLLQGVSRGDKMDFIIQKSVELGAMEITPVFTERCNIKLDAKRLSKKLNHWNKTIISATEQSGRAILTKLNKPITIDQIETSHQCSVYLDPTGNVSLKQIGVKRHVRIMIGPEGGFSATDENILKKQQFTGVKIGPRVLRTETAGLAAISLLQSLHGDFR